MGSVNSTPSNYSTYRVAEHFIVSCLHFLPQLTLTTSTSSLSPISSTSHTFPTVSPSQTSPMILKPYVPCDVPRQCGESTQIPSLTGYEPKTVEFEDIETEAIEPEDLEPRRIELGRNLGKDPHQIQEICVRNNYQNPVAEDVDEFGKVGSEMSYFQSQMHFDYDSAESIADAGS